MKSLFVIALVVLGAALWITRWSEPDMRSDVPIIYWVIDPAPVRGEHIASFHHWQIKAGHSTEHVLRTSAELSAFGQRHWSAAMRTAIAAGNPDGAAVLAGRLPAGRLPVTVRVPNVEMRLDAASNDLGKKLIQGVSGVAGDVLDTYNCGAQMRFLAAANMLADMTEAAPRLGFGPDQTYPALAPSLFYNDRQYAFARNPATFMLWVNRDAFARAGQPLPPRRWTFEEFEARGKAFVAAANPPGKRRTVFFANQIDYDVMRRSLGLSVFNETLTRCTLDDPRAARVYALLHKWTYTDHLLPSRADVAGFSSSGGGGDPAGQLFAAGNYALLYSGRWQLMQLRRLGAVPLAVVEPPHGGFPNTCFSGGQVTVYRGSKQLELAMLFPAFYASEDYNLQIVRDGDGLPPNPIYTETEAYRRPAAFTNEWGCHDVFADDAKLNGIVQSFSPFVQPEVAIRLEWMAIDNVLSDRATPAEAAHWLAERTNREIDLSLRESSQLRTQYGEYAALQARLDDARKNGRRVPADWLKNPYHQRYYAVQGWVETSATERAAGGDGP